MSKKNPLRVAVIGAGYMAAEHLRAFAGCPDVQLVGIHSRSVDRATELAKHYPGLQIALSIDELWACTNAHIVVIAVPVLACLKVCEEAFRHDWSLLIEKPVGHNLKEALKIERLADSHQARAYVALNRRFYGSTLQLQQQLQANETPRVVTVLDQEDTTSALASGQPAEVVQNWMYANSIHLIDYFSQLCRGDHLETNVLCPWRQESPGAVIAQLEFSSGDIGLYHAAWNTPGPWSVAVSTQQLRAELRPIEQLSLQRAGCRQAELQATDPLDQQFKPGLRRQAQAAICAVRGKAHNLPTIKEANKSMNLVASIYEAN